MRRLIGCCRWGVNQTEATNRHVRTMRSKSIKEVDHLSAKGFPVVLEPEEDGGYVVTCPIIPGCYSQGDSLQEALDNIREAIELCLEDYRERGEAAPNPDAVTIGNVVVQV